jgi:hypothetical protein
LHAYDATNAFTEFWNSTQGSGNGAGNVVKFTVPTIANWRIAKEHLHLGIEFANGSIRLRLMHPIEENLCNIVEIQLHLHPLG